MAFLTDYKWSILKCIMNNLQIETILNHFVILSFRGGMISSVFPVTTKILNEEFWIMNVFNYSSMRKEAFPD